jgi:hypothetical protein
LPIDPKEILTNMAVAIKQETTTSWSHLKPNWHGTAPRRVIEKYGTDDAAGGWTAWQKHLARRRRPVLPNFHRGEPPALLWGWPLGAIDIALPCHELDPSIPSTFHEIAPRTSPGVAEAIQLLALAYELPERAQKTSDASWWRWAERLHDLASEAQRPRIDWPAEPQNVLRQQLLAGELALALSYLFPEVARLRALRPAARAVLSEALVEVTDGQGLPHGRLLPVLGPLFACWTRVRWIGERLARGPWSRKAEYQYQWLVRHAIRLAGDGQQFMLSPPAQRDRDEQAGGAPSVELSGPCWSKPLLSTALDLVGDRADCAAASKSLRCRVVPKHLKFDADDLPDASLNSDWSGISVLASGWARSASRLAVAYADDPVRLELFAGGERLLVGPWEFETTCDGEPVQIASEWEELCWQSDKRADFLELAVSLSHGLRLERQLLLGKKDRVLYLADLILAADGQPHRLKHAMHVPLDERVRWQGLADTRDGQLHGEKQRAAVMPLALPEWRTDPRGGELGEVDGALVLTQEVQGRALCCPLFFDLKPGRAKKERTWRQLTVAEWMEVVPHDAAVGFRAQSGRDQWLVYRSLGPAGNRTVLGQNIAGEFCVGRFHSTGKFDEWLEIEGSE